MDLPKFITEATFWAILVALIALIIPAIIVHDYHFIIQHPVYFTLETITLAVIPALAIMVFYLTRSIKLKETLLSFVVLAIKFGILHILFQLAGVYTYVFQHITRG